MRKINPDVDLEMAPDECFLSDIKGRVRLDLDRPLTDEDDMWTSFPGVYQGRPCAVRFGAIADFHFEGYVPSRDIGATIVGLFRFTDISPTKPGNQTASGQDGF